VVSSSTAKPSRMRLVPLADRGVQQVGTGAVADLLEEVHLGQPIIMKPAASPATACSITFLYAVASACGSDGLGNLQLGHQAEFHRGTSDGTSASKCRRDKSRRDKCRRARFLASKA